MNHTDIFIKTISTTLTIIMKNMVINAFIRKYNGIVSVTVEPFFFFFPFFVRKCPKASFGKSVYLNTKVYI